jgi:hypothetical protein
LKAAQAKKFERPCLEKNQHKKRAGGVAQVVGPEFKPQYHKKRERERETTPACPLVIYGKATQFTQDHIF